VTSPHAASPGTHKNHWEGDHQTPSEGSHSGKSQSAMMKWHRTHCRTDSEAMLQTHPSCSRRPPAQTGSQRNELKQATSVPFSTSYKKSRLFLMAWWHTERRGKWPAMTGGLDTPTVCLPGQWQLSVSRQQVASPKREG
jgi:hypothetical protein